MIAIVLATAGMTLRSAEAQLTVNSGTNTISTGTSVTTTTVATGASDTGTLIVTTSGSLNASSTLTAGSSGTGVLRVTGGYVSNTSGLIGSGSGSNGTATVSSGTWANNTSLVVGASGTGTLTLNGGLVIANSSLPRGACGTINLNSGGTLQIGSGVSDGVLLGGTGALTNNGTLIFSRHSSIYSGVLSGSGAVVKQTSTTLTLSGSSSYSGGTTITGGTLAIGNANALGTGNLTVNGGTLGGSGTLGALVTVQSGGVLSPGNSPGALAAAALDLQAGSTTLMQVIGSGSSAGVAGTDYDQVRITTASSLTYGGNLVLSFIDTPLFANGTMFSLFYFTGTAGGAFNSVMTASGSSSYSGMTFRYNPNGNWYTPDTSNGQYLAFNPASGRLAVVPEPSTWVMSVIGAGAMALKTRRRRRAA